MDGNGVAGMIIISDEWDHSRKFPAFSTRKLGTIQYIVSSRSGKAIKTTVNVDGLFERESCGSTGNPVWEATSTNAEKGVGALLRTAKLVPAR